MFKASSLMMLPFPKLTQATMIITKFTVGQLEVISQLSLVVFERL